MSDLAPRYDPKPVEERIYRLWEEGGCFRSEPDAGRPRYSVVIPPPNVTGVLHMGHALNCAIQDLMVRWQRMRGCNVLWLPGTDHAGIATQNVVERELAKEGTTRHALGREAFLKRVWEWKERSGTTILSQLKRLGASCDWSRERFTMDPGLSAAVREAFVRLYERGLVYRGEYMIHWCPRCRTALSDEEVDHEETEGHLYWIRYPWLDGVEAVQVATTRPETMLGDTAVAVHPEDDRYKRWIGRQVSLPLTGRSIPIVADGAVEPKFGSGAVKVTPAHDPNDFEIGRRHRLACVKVMGEDGRMTSDAGPYAGLDRFECRKRIVEDLKADGLVEKVEKHRHAVGHCQRCGTVIEPMISRQWFVQMEPLAKPALEAVRGKTICFVPERWEKLYFHWMENIRPWCISRQLWWGHRIPVWYCGRCREGNGEPFKIVAREAPAACPRCSGAVDQDPDVLDTWFSSWLWPFSTLGWPKETKELNYYYPTDLLVTGPDIIFFWVARMIMAGHAFLEQRPFRTVYFHGIVRDEQNRKMSKSLGNAIDPIEMIDRYGADALRFSLLILTAQGQDVKLSEKKMEQGRNFANKLWNATRLVLMHPPADPPAKPGSGAVPFEDAWILSRLETVRCRVEGALGDYRLNEATLLLYDFAWEEYCSWYLELAKPRLQEGMAQATALYVLDQLLRMLHPFVPFVTEELWAHLRDRASPAWIDPDARFLASQLWLEPLPGYPDEGIEREMCLVQEVVRSIRNIRTTYGVPEQTEIPEVGLLWKPEKDAVPFVRGEAQIYRLAKVGKFNPLAGTGVRDVFLKRCATVVLSEATLYVPLEGLVDLEKERSRLEHKCEEVRRRLEGIGRKLNDPAFLQKAPEPVVERERALRSELLDQQTKLEQTLKQLF
jgi:valyl-tRNA synthetase